MLIAAFTVTATFSELITGGILGIGDISRSGTATYTLGSFTDLSTRIAIDLFVCSKSNRRAGTIILSLPLGDRADNSGNTNTVSNTLTRTYDVTPPTLTARTLVTDGNVISGVKYAKSGNTITLNITASKKYYYYSSCNYWRLYPQLLQAFRQQLHILLLY